MTKMMNNDCGEMTAPNTLILPAPTSERMPRGSGP